MAIAERCLHEAGARAIYDSRNLPAKRTYLQCVLALAELLAAGVVSFPSGQPGAYYALVLRPIPINQGALAYRRRFEGQASALDMRALENAAPIPIVVAGVPAIQDDDSFAGGEEEMPGAAMPAAAEVAAEEVRAEAQAEVAEPAQPSVTSGGSVAGGESVAAGDLPRAVLGQPLRPVRGRCDMTWSYNDRVMVRCNNLAHEGCLKTRSDVQ